MGTDEQIIYVRADGELKAAFRKAARAQGMSMNAALVE